MIKATRANTYILIHTDLYWQVGQGSFHTTNSRMLTFVSTKLI